MSLIPESDFEKNTPARVENRRRNGYELAHAHDLYPVVLGAGCAAILVHAMLLFYFPDVIELGVRQVLNLSQRVEVPVADRVVVKPEPKEQELPEAQEEEIQEQPDTPEEIAHEPEEIDLMDIIAPELVIAPGETDLTMPKPEFKTEEAPSVADMPPSQLDVSALQMSAISQDAIAPPEPTPVNTNEVVANAMAQPDSVEDTSSLMEAEMRRTASEQGSNMPPDTRSLAQLMGETNLGAGSGVARLGADVLFGFNECVLKNSARITMLQLAALIQKNPGTYFLIEGHTDSLGGDSYNALLGLQRAAAVREWLVGNGIPVRNVYIRTCGSTKPLADVKGDKDKQAMNRRVEIHMRREGEEIPSGACDSSYKVDLKTPVQKQLARGVRPPVIPSRKAGKK